MNQKQKQNINNSRRRRNLNAPRYGSIVPVRRSLNYNTARFNNVADPLVLSAYAASPAQIVLTSDATGYGRGSIRLAPIGVNAVEFSTGAQTTLESPHLPWMYQTSRNFGSFRILRANLIVVGNTGANVPGSITIHSTRDFSDTSGVVSSVLVGGVQFDVSSLATKNRVIPLQVDSSWKKVTNTTSTAANGIIIPVNSVNDLVFTNITWIVTSGPVDTGIATGYIEYDVEFINPVATGYNG